MRTTPIGDAALGPDHPCYVIAEAGVNHDGNLEIARSLVHAAREAGADAVKFQLFRGAEVASASAPKAEYQLAVTDPAESQRAMLEALELPDTAFAELANEAARAGIDFLCTAYSEHALDVLEAIGVPAFKFASAQIVELPLIAHAAAKGRTLLISTGMATLDEIAEALEAAKGGGDPPVVLLQCTTDYPSVLEDANTRTIPALAERFGVPVGYSDHTIGDVAAVAAVACGAVLIEKHLTLDRSRPGPDHSSSLEPDEFASLLHRIRETEAALGSDVKEPTPHERANTFGMRRSLFAAEDIPAGTLIERRHVTLRRPASGLHPRELGQILGGRAAVDIAADTPLTADHFTR